MNKYNKNYISDINQDLYYELMSKKYLIKKSLDIIKVKNGIVIPPFNPKKFKNRNPSKALFGSAGVLNDNNEYVEESAQLAYAMKNRIYKVNSYNKQNTDIVHSKVIYMNFFIKQWGHFLIDVIGRLWYALQDKDTKIVYTCYDNENYKIEGNYLDFLKLLGIDEKRLIRINKPTKFDCVIVPETSIYPGKYYTFEYKNIFDIVVKNANITRVKENKKIYCSRLNYGKNNKKEFGEEIIEENFKKNGYDVVYMEKLSLREQIILLNKSEFIAMTCGSLSHNLLFIRNNVNVFILNKTYRINLHQIIINEIANSINYFIDIYVSPLPILYGYGPFILRPTKEFEKLFKDFNLDLINNKRNISIFLRIKYYIIYIVSYRKFILRLKKIRETPIEKYELNYRTIRKYYKNYLKLIDRMKIL